MLMLLKYSNKTIKKQNVLIEETIRPFEHIEYRILSNETKNAQILTRFPLVFQIYIGITGFGPNYVYLYFICEWM